MLTHDSALAQVQNMDSDGDISEENFSMTPSLLTDIESALVSGAPEVINNPD